MGIAGVRGFAYRCHRGQLVEPGGELYIAHIDRVLAVLAYLNALLGSKSAP